MFAPIWCFGTILKMISPFISSDDESEKGEDNDIYEQESSSWLDVDNGQVSYNWLDDDDEEEEEEEGII